MAQESSSTSPRLLPDGFSRVSGKYVDLITDMPVNQDLQEIPVVFDLAIPKWCEMFSMNVDEVQELGWDCGYETFHLLEVVIQNCMEAGYFPGRDLHEVAMENWAMCHGMLSLHLKDRLIMIPQEHRIALLDQTLRSHMEQVKATKASS